MLDELLVRHLPLRRMLDRLRQLNAELTERERALSALLADIEAAEAAARLPVVRPAQPPSLARRLGSLPRAPRPRRRA